jgi:beta-aspartyl-peptidase (threonine type)
MTTALIVHGGAGNWRPDSESDAIEGVREAVAAGRRILEAGGAALDAACAAAVVLEDNPIFNAGTGAVLNFDGFCELDACVMVSERAEAGAVAGVQRVKNPILVARKIMEETDHVMLAGEGAQRFARVMGFPDHDPITPARRADWRKKRDHIDEILGEGNPRTLRMRRFLREHPEYAGGTIGAVALDAKGVLCAATSTGGVTLKLAGRVGDTPLPGAGTYASKYAAVSATGTGEFVMRSLATRQISDYVQQGMSLTEAIRSVLDQLGRDFDADVGFIAIDAQGDAAANHRTRDMPHAWFCGSGEIVANMRVSL